RAVTRLPSRRNFTWPGVAADTAMGLFRPIACVAGQMQAPGLTPAGMAICQDAIARLCEPIARKNEIKEPSRGSGKTLAARRRRLVGRFQIVNPVWPVMILPRQQIIKR